MEKLPSDSTGFPQNSYEVDIPDEEWAAYMLLKDTNLLNAKNVTNAAESVVDFYDPRTRTLAPDDNPVFQQKIKEVKSLREENVNYISFALKISDLRIQLSKESVDFYYDGYLGDAEYRFDVALAEWGNLEHKITNLLHTKNTAEEDPFEDRSTVHEIQQQIDDLLEEKELARGNAFYAWMEFREKLQIFINRIRLASLIIARRNQAGLSQEDFATVANLSPSTIKNFENVDEPGRWFSSKTVSLMEFALGWKPGGMAAVLRGDDPTPVSDWAPLQRPQTARTTTVNEGTQNAIFNIQLVNHSLYESVELFAAQKGRRIDEVVEDAITLYLKVHG